MKPNHMEPMPASDESEPKQPRTLAERRMRLEQALASTRIEGHQPSPEFLADMEALITGSFVMKRCGGGAQSGQAWQVSKPHLFKRVVYKQAGLDNYPNDCSSL
ncbi:MAG: antitoxin VbhA family protein [Pelomonas sp.]|nr:antitoxin VbhA family protein [Roseateles sp.]